jgi:hypothetical protein
VTEEVLVTEIELKNINENLGKMLLDVNTTIALITPPAGNLMLVLLEMMKFGPLVLEIHEIFIQQIKMVI